jgi:hypothetical protein
LEFRKFVKLTTPRITFFLLLISVSANAQQLATVKGVVMVDSIPYANVNIVNRSFGPDDGKVVRSNDIDGKFEIVAKAGDTLNFSSAELIARAIVLTSEDLTSFLRVEMSFAVLPLKEITVYDTGKYNALSLGIIRKEIKTRSPAERRLYTAGEFKPIQLLGILGGSLPVDPIINAINGKTKKLKQEVVIEKKESNVIFLQENYTDYMLLVLKVPEDRLQAFIYFVVESAQMQDMSSAKNGELIKFRLADLYTEFLNVSGER